MSDSTRRPSGGKASRPKKPRKNFPLSIHKGTGYWCKKVRGRVHYFGKVADDPKGQAALEQWLQQKDDLLAGREPRAKRDELAVRDLLNLFLSGKREYVEAGEIRLLLDKADVQLRAMILLGVNSGLGNTDCGRLESRHLDLKRAWLDYPRPKTGIPRRCPLWPETVAALEAVLGERRTGLVFRTRFGNGWTRDAFLTPDGPRMSVHSTSAASIGWSTSAIIEQETVRAVVQAFAEVKIALPGIALKTSANHYRYAPSFVSGDASGGDRDHPYIAQMIAWFLSWHIDKVKDTLAALELQELKILDAKDFEGLGTRAARAVTWRPASFPGWRHQSGCNSGSGGF